MLRSAEMMHTDKQSSLIIIQLALKPLILKSLTYVKVVKVICICMYLQCVTNTCGYSLTFWLLVHYKMPQKFTSHCCFSLYIFPLFVSLIYFLVVLFFDHLNSKALQGPLKTKSLPISWERQTTVPLKFDQDIAFRQLFAITADISS